MSEKLHGSVLEGVILNRVLDTMRVSSRLDALATEDVVPTGGKPPHSGMFWQKVANKEIDVHRLLDTQKYADVGAATAMSGGNGDGWLAVRQRTDDAMGDDDGFIQEDPGGDDQQDEFGPQEGMSGKTAAQVPMPPLMTGLSSPRRSARGRGPASSRPTTARANSGSLQSLAATGVAMSQPVVQVDLEQIALRMSMAAKLPGRQERPSSAPRGQGRPTSARGTAGGSSTSRSSGQMAARSAAAAAGKAPGTANLVAGRREQIQQGLLDHVILRDGKLNLTPKVPLHAVITVAAVRPDLEGFRRKLSRIRSASRIL